MSRYFPAIDEADTDGVLAVGGLLSAERLIDAYRHGIFPWPDARGRVEWCSPPLRALFEFDEFHISRRLARTIRSGQYEVTRDRDFRGVMTGCATAGDRREGTWITSSMIDAYSRLHELGVTHSVETWQAGQLVGGVYGVAIGAMFAAESSFYRCRDASKVALTHLVGHLRDRGYQLLDIQQWTPHSASLGCRPIRRAAFSTPLSRSH